MSLDRLLEPVVVQAEGVAEDWLLHRVYSDLLGLCPLSSAHRKHLLNEGWSTEEVRQFRAGSWPEARQAQREILQELWKLHGVLLAQVPGFVVKGERASLHVPAGLLLPCAGWEGLIHRLRLRPDRVRPLGPKYVWVSSSRYGGPSAGAPPAFYRPFDEVPPRRILITEGEKKACLAAQRLSLQGYPVIAVSLAGVGNHKELLPILERHRGELDEVVIAFDEDEKEQTRERVDVHRRNLCEALAGMGIPVLVARWRGLKGLDDLLVAGGRFQLQPYQPMAQRPKLAAEALAPRQLELGESAAARQERLNLEQARAFLRRELLREIRMPDAGDKVILLQAEPGVGKTYLLTSLTNEMVNWREYRGKRLVNVTPRHDFAEHGRQDWNIVTGLNYRGEGAGEACHQLRYVNQAQELGIARQEICERCPLRQACESNHGRALQDPFYLAMINSPEPRWQINQNLLGTGRGIWQNEKLGMLALDDVDLYQVLVQKRTLSWWVLRSALEWCERDRGYAAMQPLLQLLVQAGQSLDTTRESDELFERGLMEKLERLAQEHGMDFGEVLEQARQAQEPALFGEGKPLQEGNWGIPPRLRDLLVSKLTREWQQYLKNPLEGWNRSLYVNRDGLVVWEAQPFSERALRGVPILVASASMTPEQVKEFFPGRKVVVLRPRLERPAGVRIRQYLDKRYGKVSLIGEMDFGRALNEMKGLLNRFAGEKVGVVTHKATEERLQAHFPQVPFLHYYGQRGSNELEDCRALVVLGTPCPNPEELLRQAEAFYSDGRKIQGYSVMKQYTASVKGEKLAVSYRGMGDERLQAWLDARQGQELFQAIGRARLYNAEASGQGSLFAMGLRSHLDIFIYSNVPIPGVEVDEYVSEWAEKLREQRLLDEERRTVLGQAIGRVRGRSERLTYAALVRESGLSLRVVRRLFRSALLWVEQNRRGSMEPATGVVLGFGVEVAGLRVPLLEQGVGLPPPVLVG